MILFFPNREPPLYFLDDVAAGEEGRLAVRGDRANPHGQLADLQPASAVHTANPAAGMRLLGLGDDGVALKPGEHIEGLIFELGDGSAEEIGRASCRERV